MMRPGEKVLVALLDRSSTRRNLPLTVASRFTRSKKNFYYYCPVMKAPRRILHKLAPTLPRRLHDKLVKDRQPQNCFLTRAELGWAIQSGTYLQPYQKAIQVCIESPYTLRYHKGYTNSRCFFLRH